MNWKVFLHSLAAAAIGGAAAAILHSATSDYTPTAKELGNSAAAGAAIAVAALLKQSPVAPSPALSPFDPPKP